MTGRHLIVSFLLIFVLSTQASAAGTPVIIQLSSNGLLGNLLPIIGGVLVDILPGTNQLLVNVGSLPLVNSVLNSLVGKLLGIQWVEVNSGVTQPPVGQRGVLQLFNPATVPDWYKAQPALALIKATQAQTYATGRGVVIADINSNLDYSHPSLRGHLTGGYDFITSKPSGETALNQSSSGFLDQSSSGFLDQSSSGFLDQSSSGFLDDGLFLSNNPAYSHGTLCAGLIAAVAPDAMIMPIRAFDDNGSTDLYMLSKAIRYAVDHGAHIINMSFGTLTDSKAIHSAIDYARQHNVILIASAGNNNTSAVQYPAAYTGVIAVASTDISDVKGSFSNFGHYVGVDAPGVNMISAYPGGLYSMVSGTSFSAPIVAGEAALLKSMQSSSVSVTINSKIVNIDAKNRNYIGLLGSGRVDLLKAVHP